MLRALLAVLGLALAVGTAAQQPPAPEAPKPAPKAVAKPAAKAAPKKKLPVARPTWIELTPEQRQVLAPLQDDWENLERERRLKWIGIAKRYPKMKPEEQERVERRMHDWANLTPEQRRQARENYRQLAKAPPEKRRKLRQQWADYQQLSPAEREKLVYEPVEPKTPKKKK
jgi:hypothetical protein